MLWWNHCGVGQHRCRADESGSAASVSFHQQTIPPSRLKRAAGSSVPNPACGFVDNSLARNRQRTGALAVDKSQETATYPPRTPLPTSSTGPISFEIQFESQNRSLRLIPLLELTGCLRVFRAHVGFGHLSDGVTAEGVDRAALIPWLAMDSWPASYYSAAS